ncbi:unnamed protein product [Nippostrongylus brasiliensis]|uniref:LETM1 domain-containing protein n=1 Tax=Nippostrongylus brasiliensis TaxID=27835 RepID=A0A0N4Y0W7_NIPBR|nr:unnamed protein product [Nippostrongylus brasiliensis]
MCFRQICQRILDVYSDLYSRCYVPHVSKRQRKISEVPLLRHIDAVIEISIAVPTFLSALRRIRGVRRKFAGEPTDHIIAASCPLLLTSVFVLETLSPLSLMAEYIPKLRNANFCSKSSTEAAKFTTGFTTLQGG